VTVAASSGVSDTVDGVGDPSVSAISGGWIFTLPDTFAVPVFSI